MSEFRDLSPTQVNALCNVAFGGRGLGSDVHPRTLKSLVDRGLIEEVEREDRRGAFRFVWTEYEMPLPVHIRFCEWCSEVAAAES